MKKIVKVEKSGKESLYTRFLAMTLIPLFIFGIAVSFFISYRVERSMEEEAKSSLANMANTVEAAYDEMYPGDYKVTIKGKSITLYKGEQLLSGNTDFIDRIKGSTELDISLFFADTRLITTLVDSNGNRYIGVPAADQIVADVFLEHNEKFYNNVTIGKAPYYAYYKPLFSEDGTTCVGMIGVAAPSSVINQIVRKTIYQCGAMLLVFLGLTAFMIVRQTSSFIDIIKRILDFLKELSNDNLDVKLDEMVHGRKDELGEIGNASVKLQHSLKRLIERDGLTGLYNRRAGEKKLDKLEADGIRSSIAIGDIDFFKKFNDSFGHACGDVVLKEVAACLNENMRGKGFVARWGGEEFLLVFENMEEIAAGMYLNEILDKIRERAIEYDGQSHSVTMTFGVASRKEDERINQQIRRADDKLYEGKQSGRNRVIM